MCKEVRDQIVWKQVKDTAQGLLRAGGNGPAALVLAGPVFQGKNKSPFLQKASNEHKC